MGLADEFDSLRTDWQPTSGGRCTVGELRSVLGAKDLVAFDALMADRRVYATVIVIRLRSLSEVLDDPEVASAMRRVTQSSVQRHRRGECLCER
jgi:hypothetical protein